MMPLILNTYRGRGRDCRAGEFGVTFVEVHIKELELVHGIFLNVIATDTSAYHRRLLRAKPQGYYPRTRVMLEFGELLFGTDYLIAQRARHVLRMAAKDTFTRHRLDGLVARECDEYCRGHVR